MELSTILTYLGLLIAAYGATQEYVRLKLKLVPLGYALLFVFSLIFLYITSLKFIQYKLIIYGTLYFYSGISYYLWESKYLIILTLNLFSLYMILRASRLTPRNQKQFLDLIHELRAYKNYAILHKLMKENLDIIFNLKYNKTFAEKTSFNRFNIHFSKIYKKYGKTDSLKEKNSYFSLKEQWIKLKFYIFKKLAKFSYKKDTVNEIFQYTISDKLIVQSIVEQNEPLGIEILKEIIKHKAFDSKFQNRFLIDIFKDTNSYIYKEFILGGSSTLFDFLNENQQYEQGLDIGLNISFAILELIEDHTEILNKDNSKFELDPLVQQLNELFYALERTDPTKSHYSNIPYYIEKTILENIDLTYEEETVGFNLLNTLFSVIKSLNVKCNGCYIGLLDSLYSSFIYKADNINDNNLIRVGCHYIDYMFNDMYIDNIDDHVKQFKQHIEQAYSGKKEKLFTMYLMVLNKRRGRGECKDYIHYTHSGINPKITSYWNEIEELLKEKVEQL